MNVIISNKNQNLLSMLNIDVIKSLVGEYAISDLASLFDNFYYNKMIIDVTSIKGYENSMVMQDLSINFDTSKIILLLDDSEIVNSPSYISKLVSMGIYNFTKNADNIPFLIEHPNTYKDVVNYQNLNPVENNNKFNDKKEKEDETGFIGQRVIGFKNITDHAGATTLIYILKNHLQKYYSTVAVEIDATDFNYFNDKDLTNISYTALQSFIIQNNDKEVILVDLNNNDESLCHEVIYLIEPGLIKLNKLIRKDNKIFDKLKGKKIILNKSVLDKKDINDFEKESGSKIFFNMPPLDDKVDNIEEINEFLSYLGFSRSSGEKKSGLFNIF